MSEEREQKILNYLREEIMGRGYPPTVREICQALAISSTSTVHKDLEKLEKKGYIKKDPSKPRALILTENNPPTPALNESIDTVEVPLVGRIAAGTPILAEQNIEDSFPIPSRFVPRGENFMLVVSGDSMVEAGIHDGDYILVNSDNTANNGEIVVAMIDDFESEATVKTYYREKDYVRLQPENSEMSPILVKDVKILGKVKGVFRYFS